MRHTNTLPQLYWLQAIYITDDAVRVEPLLLDANQQGEFVLDPAGGDIVLTVSGITPITAQPTAYTYTLE